MVRAAAVGVAVLVAKTALASVVWAPRCEASPSLELRYQRGAPEQGVAPGAAAADESRTLYEEAERLGITKAVVASGLPPWQQRRVAVAIVREAHKNAIDPLLVVALIRTESSFNNYAVSSVGAMGLMQVMPDTGQFLAQRSGFVLGRKTNLFDSELNIQLGTSYLAELIERFGSVPAALVAYNAGPAAARHILQDRAARLKFLAGYPKKVLSELSKLRRAQTAPPRWANAPIDHALADRRE